MREKIEGTEMYLVYGKDAPVDKTSRETALATAQAWVLANANRIKEIAFEDEDGKTPATMANLCEAMGIASTEELSQTAEETLASI